jgi:hypothetical protein
MYGNRFYNQLTRKYVALFGTLFNDIKIGRAQIDGELDFAFDVPVNYGPMQKFLARIDQDPDFNAPALTLPRMSFEIVNMAYDPTRKLTNSIQSVSQGVRNDTLKAQYTPAPYNLDFELNIMTKYNEDGTKILEQIIPFFKPEQVLSVELIEESNLFFDVPIILNSVQHTDDYEGDFQTRRALIWTLSFTVKGYYFGPTLDRKVVKFARTRIFDDLEAKLEVEPIDLGTSEIVEETVTPVAEYSVYMDEFVDENGFLSYGISNTDSTDFTHDANADNLSTSTFTLNQPLPELTIVEDDTINIVNESENYRLVLTTSPYDPATGEIGFSVDNLVDANLAVDMPALNGSSIKFTPTEFGSYYYMSPDRTDVAGLITVLDRTQLAISVDTDAGTSDDIDANTVTEETFTSNRGTFTTTGDLPVTTVDVRPGLTITNEPTEDIEESLNLSEIDWDDNWGIIVDIKDETEYEPLGINKDEQY